MHAFRLLILLCFVTVTASACVKTTTVRHSPDYARELEKLKTTAALPPLAVVHTENASYQKEREYDYEYYAEDRLREMLTDALNERGYHIRSVSKGELKDESLYNIKDRMHLNAEKIKGALYSKGPLMDVNEAHGIDERLARYDDKLATALESDILLFAGFKETVKTAGAQTRDLTLSIALAIANGQNHINVQPGESANIYAGLFDGKDGRLLWMNSITDASGTILNVGGFGKTETEKTDQKLLRLTELLLEPLPAKHELGAAQDALDTAAAERPAEK